MLRPLILLTATLLLIPALLTAQDTTKAKPRIKRTPDFISQEEIEAAPPDVQDAYALVERLHPLWFQKRGVPSMAMAPLEVVVYVNDVRRGDPQTLRSIPRNGIREIRHLSGTDASQRFGVNHDNGAILVTLR